VLGICGSMNSYCGVTPFTYQIDYAKNSKFKSDLPIYIVSQKDWTQQERHLGKRIERQRMENEVYLQHQPQNVKSNGK
jgi:hypothetical protein